MRETVINLHSRVEKKTAGKSHLVCLSMGTVPLFGMERSGHPDHNIDLQSSK